jgi:hypothetical protein
LYRAGGSADDAGPLAAWAQQAHAAGLPDRGIIVAEIGTPVAETTLSPSARGLRTWYVCAVDSRRLGLFGNEVGIALGQIERAVGQRVAHFTGYDLCHGASKDIPDVPSGPRPPFCTHPVSCQECRFLGSSCQRHRAADSRPEDCEASV